MSMLNRPANGNDIGETVASTREYESAQKTVSKLIAGEVPARDIVIVGQGVRTVERVTGRLGYAAAARSGAINGVLIGLLLSAIMLFGTPDAPISLFLGFLLIGVALGMIMSLVTYAIVRRRRDFASVTQMIADHYEVRVQPTSLAKARQVVGPERPAATRPTADVNEPPRYGERLPGAGTPGAGTPGAGAPGAGGPGASGVSGAPMPPAPPVMPPAPPVVTPAPPVAAPGDSDPAGDVAIGIDGGGTVGPDGDEAIGAGHEPVEPVEPAEPTRGTGSIGEGDGFPPRPGTDDGSPTIGR